MAGLNLHKKILEYTPNISRDQDHLPVVHLSISARVSDRTAYLMTHKGTNPGEEMFSILTEHIRSDVPEGLVCVPCNTFHAPEIVSVFTQKMKEHFPQLSFVHIERTLVSHLAGQGVRTVGILSTTGSRVQGIYRNSVQDVGIAVLDVTEEEQERVQDAIYNPVYGIKATACVSQKAGDCVQSYIEMLCARGAETVILGCTELSLVLEARPELSASSTDTVTVLAQALIRAAREDR